MCPRFLFVDTNKSVHKGHHPHSHAWRTHGRIRTLTDNRELVGDQYVFVSMDSETKLVPNFRVGKRNAANAWYFVQNLQTRMANRIQLTSGGFRPCKDAVDDAFGVEVDYAMLVKMYSDSGQADSRYSPGEIVDVRTIPITGNPKPRLISTSHIERQNLTMRMQLRRFTCTAPLRTERLGPRKVV